MYLGVDILQQFLHLRPSHGLEPSHPALGQDQTPERPAELVLGGRPPRLWVPRVGRGGWGPGLLGPGQGGGLISPSHLHPGPLPSVTHVLKIGGNSDGVILKQVLGLREKTGSGLRRQEETNYGDPE